jgi:hypothetical protein
LQALLEEIVLEEARCLHGRFPNENLCLADWRDLVVNASHLPD